MPETPPPLSDSFLSKLHLAEFAAGFFSPEIKADLLKLEPLLPSLRRHGIALEEAAVAVWGDIRTVLWPMIEPNVRAYLAKINAGTPQAEAVAAVRADAIEAHGDVDRQAFQG